MGSQQQALKTNIIYAWRDIFDSTDAGISISIQIFEFWLDSDDDMMVYSGSWPIYDM